MSDIRTVQKREEQDVATTLTLAFATDPVFRYWLPRAPDYLKWFAPFALAMGDRGFEHGTVSATANFEAAAMWLPPGVEPDHERANTLEMPGTRETAKIAAELQEQMARYHPTEPHWYLWMIGVDPRCQGKGHGSALLKHMLERCDREHAMAYLESSSPKNVPLYERHGFEAIGVIEVRDVPPIVPMLRRAR
jgi:ribosomal protein S18 acetylase RimI-like enzyme